MLICVLKILVRAVLVPSLWGWCCWLYLRIRQSQNGIGNETKISSKGHVTMGSTHRGTTGTAYCKCHWVSDSSIQTRIYPVQLFGWLTTEQETRSLRLPELVAARPPVSPRCTELQRDLLWLGDKRSWRSRPEGAGGERDCQGPGGRWGRCRDIICWCLNPWETCGYVGHAGLCNRSLRFLVATKRNYLK